MAVTDICLKEGMAWCDCYAKQKAKKKQKNKKKKKKKKKQKKKNKCMNQDTAHRGFLLNCLYYSWSAPM
jgi:hypothetical protein